MIRASEVRYPSAWLLLLAALLGTAIVTSGCSSGASPSAPSESESESQSSGSYEINSWQSWGRAGVEWTNHCEKYGWGCIDDQIRSLELAAANLPEDETHSGVLRVTSLYRDTFRSYITSGCDGPVRAAACSSYEMRLTSFGNQLNTGLSNLAAGKPASG